mgnify:CR=1 FL=1
MKFTALSLVASTILLTLSATMLPAQAQMEDLLQNQAQWQQRRQEWVETLGLTPAQQAQLDALQAQRRDQLQGLLTPEQRETLANGLRNGQELRSLMGSLNLTEAQRQQLRAAGQSFRQEARAVLTTEQQQQLRQLMQQHRGERGQRGRFRR